MNPVHPVQEQHERGMRLALAQAEIALATGEPPFGVVILDAEQNVVAATHDEVNRLGDMSAHAEVLAVRAASQSRGPSLTGFTLYTTCEPCPMCFTAAWLAGISGIVYATTMDEVHGILGDAQRELKIPVTAMNSLSRQPVVLVEGVLRAPCLALFHTYASHPTSAIHCR